MLGRQCAAFAAVVAGLLVASCGNPSLPDQGECPEIVGFEATVLQDRAYRITIARELEAISELDAGFRARWTERRLRELESFRQEFALYAHLTTCHAQYIEDASAPEGVAPAIQTAIDDYAARLVATMEQGVDAVASRNRSAYQDWIRAIDALAEETVTLRERVLNGTG